MRLLKAKVIGTAMTFFWAVQAFAAEPKTEKIEVTLDIPPNPFLDQICVFSNYLTIGAIICSVVFGGIWLMQKKDARDDEEDDDEEDEEISVPPVELTKEPETLPAEQKIELKTEAEPSPQDNVEEAATKTDSTPEETKVDETKVENETSEEQAPAATKKDKAEKSGTAKRTRKTKKKE